MLEDDAPFDISAPQPARQAGSIPGRFESILFPASAPEMRQVPACFRDLQLDRIVASVTAGREDYDLAPFFHAPLKDLDGIAWRQEVMRDLEDKALMKAIQAFSDQMRWMRSCHDQAKAGYYEPERQRWFLDAVACYGDAVERLRGDLASAKLQSRGLRALHDHLAGYVVSPAFRQPIDAARKLKDELAAIRFCLLLNGSSVTVRYYDGEDDYGATVATTFEKFRRGAVKNYLAELPEHVGMNHITAQIAERVARLYPSLFDAVAAFCAEHAEYDDASIVRFDREIQFYVAWLAHLEPLRRAGLPFCYPQLSATSKEIVVRDAFDLALAAKLLGARKSVVTNDIFLTGPERVLVVSGPNQGGKTTFARMLGQLHYLASLGCPVPGSQARLFLCDRIFTHFEREEDITTLRGKLHDDLYRMHRILEAARPNSLIVINEIFASTTLKDAIDLGRRIMGWISRLDALAVCVTFLAELASFDHKTVSVVAQISSDDPAVRTYKLLREPANGLSYALAIARKHGVTYPQLIERLKS